MKTISLVYISLSGNTESFVTRLKDYLLSQYEGIEVQKIHIKDLVKEGQDFYEMDHPYVAFLPTYLEAVSYTHLTVTFKSKRVKNCGESICKIWEKFLKN